MTATSQASELSFSLSDIEQQRREFREDLSTLLRCYPTVEHLPGTVRLGVVPEWDQLCHSSGIDSGLGNKDYGAALRDAHVLVLALANELSRQLTSRSNRSAPPLVPRIAEWIAGRDCDAYVVESFTSCGCHSCWDKHLRCARTPYAADAFPYLLRYFKKYPHLYSDAYVVRQEGEGYGPDVGVILCWE